ncbi:MAG: hypothetical protein HY046_07280 [Acidobacteria bacterium]|nr:hypothetical protein [Acidobacteriota bacterium]
MADKVKCNCPRCRLDGITGPVVLITVGILFLIQQASFRWNFGDLWPIILIVIGLVRVAQAAAPTTGHNTGEIPAEAKPNV